MVVSEHEAQPESQPCHVVPFPLFVALGRSLSCSFLFWHLESLWWGSSAAITTEQVPGCLTSPLRGPPSCAGTWRRSAASLNCLPESPSPTRPSSLLLVRLKWRRCDVQRLCPEMEIAPR